MNCPACTEPLRKRNSDGEGVYRCEPCSMSWFILLVRKPFK